MLVGVYRARVLARLFVEGVGRQVQSTTLVMGVPVSVKRPTSTYEFSFASFSTTGTLQSSIAEGNSKFLG